MHAELIRRGVLAVNSEGIASNADKANTPSREIARRVADLLVSETHERQAGQTSGSKFEILVAEFLERTFPKLQHLRPGEWKVVQLGNRAALKTSSFVQYEHLDYLRELTNENERLRTILGNDYMVAPDVVVYRNPVSEDELNGPLLVADDDMARLTELRALNNDKPLLEASVSAKWTMRSDRAQNSRTEALNLIRNRKGQTPHIVVVTGEPLPSRIASLALGTGDIDCVYHFALYELVRAVEEYGAMSDRADIIEQLDTLIAGKRLKDISDLPLDLCL
ncbi:MAG: NgoMIV family type II restriction endonuclease [Coriobacteriaceae bacterium]|uniref:NgoMIV family type II restriction endonuclease n=1 Tax=Tractidigestivibacter sp. TaxID=2847320 RepID=UPI002A92087A|nr:NgoMIV family type II restriction endonuclease [Tractidigestivibacter sp.]MCI6843251.1 NgoMIV family type II restriction endonuclease [Coriobacteriaceae bacterium]